MVKNPKMDTVHFFLNHFWIDIDNDVFQIGVDVQGFRSGFPGAVAGLFHPAERHVRLTAESPGVDHRHTGQNFLAEFGGAMDIAGMNAGGQPVG